MRASRAFVLTASLVSVLAFSGAAHARYEGNLNLFVGQKWLQQADWTPVEDQPDLGLMFAFGDERFPVHFAIDVLASKDEADFVDPVLGPSKKKGSTLEYAFGVRRTWTTHKAHPQIGGGASIVSAHRDVTSATGTVKHDDLGYGGWIEAGLSWRLAGHLNLGVDVRYTLVDVDLGTQMVPDDVPAGGIHAGLLIGYGW